MEGDRTGPDLKRLGIFKELEYQTINTPYVPPTSHQFRVFKPNKDTQPLYLSGGHSKTRSANRDGYFNEFQRTFEGEEYISLATRRRRWRNEAAAKNIEGKRWTPNSPGGQNSGIGSQFGCFDKIILALNPASNAAKNTEPLPNVFTSPGKKGTGYGYLDITLSKYPAWEEGQSITSARLATLKKENEIHLAKVAGRSVFVSTAHGGDPFELNPWLNGDPLAPGGPVNSVFGAPMDKSKHVGPTFLVPSPAKVDGGCKAGTLNKWPEYSHELYVDRGKFERELFSLGQGKLPEGNKIWQTNPPCALVMPNPSVLNHVINTRVNSQNRKQIASLWFKTKP